MNRINHTLTALTITAGITAAAIGQAKPDLVISRASVISDPSGLYIEKVSASVDNACVDTRSGQSYLLVTFKTGPEPGAKSIYFIGNTVRSLAGGESDTQTFDVAAKKIGVGRYILIEADSYRKVAERNEDNNWRTLNPDGAGTALNRPPCRTIL